VHQSPVNFNELSSIYHSICLLIDVVGIADGKVIHREL